MEILNPEKLVYSSRLLEYTTNHGKIAYIIRDFDPATKKDRVNVNLYDVSTRNIVQLTRHSYGGDKCGNLQLFNSNIYDESVPNQLAYLKQGKLHILPLNGGESYEARISALEIDSFKIFEDCLSNQLKIIVVMEVYPNLSPAETIAYDQEHNSKEGSGMHFQQLMIRHWDRWNTYHKRNHLFLGNLEVQSDESFTVTSLVDLMQGIHSDCPGKAPGQGNHDYVVSPNGEYIAMICRNYDEETLLQPNDFAWTTHTPLFLASLSSLQSSVDTKRPPIAWKRILPVTHRVYTNAPTFSADSTKLLFLAMKRAGYEADRSRIYLYFLTEDRYVNLTEEMTNCSFDSVYFDPEDDHILYANLAIHGSYRIVRLQLNTNYDQIIQWSWLQGDDSRMNIEIDITADGFDKYILFTESNLVKAFELKKLSIPTIQQTASPSILKQDSILFPSNFTPMTMTFIDWQQRAISQQHQFLPIPIEYAEQSFVTIACPAPHFSNGDIAMPLVQQYYFPGANQELVHGFYLLPSTFPTTTATTNATAASTADVILSSIEEAKSTLAAKSIPLLIIIHGGPQGAFCNAWNYRWNLATFAASQGYAVFAMNYHGSTSYGQNFCDSIRHQWGGAPYDDIRAGLAFILQEHPYLNDRKVAALGASYGGYMVNWLQGHNDDHQFCCFVNHAGIFSLRTEFFTTEELFFPGMSA
jgi:hypothetical protein